MVDSQLKAAVRTYRIKPAFVKAIVLSPVAIVLLYGFSIAFPPTRSIAMSTLEEGYLVEALTFWFLLLGGISGLALAWRMRKRGVEVLVVGFYALFSIGLMLIAMEEVAWGQHLLGFGTPSMLKEINAQDEVTLHNIGELQGRSEFFRLAFGLGGLLGVWASSSRRFRKVGVPTILLPWFSIVAILAGVDLYSDYYPIQAQLDSALQRLSELVEMMIGVSGFLFVWLNARMLSFFTDAKDPSSPSVPTRS